MSTSEVHDCPICGADIMVKRTTVTKWAVLDASGDLTDDGKDAGLEGDSEVYCENKHSHAQMRAKLAGEEDAVVVTREELHRQLQSAEDSGSAFAAAHIRSVLNGDEPMDDWLFEWILDARKGE